MPSRDRGVATIIVILIVAGVMALLLAGYLYFRSPALAPARSVAGRALREEQKAYIPWLEFTDAHMSAAENFLGGTVTYLDVRVTNKGARPIRQLDVQLEFTDTFNQVVLRETAYPVTERTPALKPGESRAFQVRFEHMPADWNQAPPRMKPIYIEF
jgi:type II secretory pathway pseudopilin PulG